jgi:nicotinamidase-related amidase
MMFQTGNPALIIIDVQKAIDCFSGYERSNLNAESNITKLLAHWRETEKPIIHVRHSSKFETSPYHTSSSTYDFKPDAAPHQDERIITKKENCAFLGTNLEQILKQNHIRELVICGVLINNSVDATVRVAAGLGYQIFLPEDATAAFAIEGLNGKLYSAEDVHWLFLSNLHGEYCSVVSTNQLISGV